MTEKTIIEAQKRNIKGKQVRQLRRQGFLPGIIYGKIGKDPIDPVLIKLDLHEASKTINRLTGSSLITVDVEGEEYPVVLREAQKDIIFGTLRHVDFLAVSMTEKLQTLVPIELVGEAPVTTAFSAVVVTGLNELEIECLPQDMPERIEVDASVLVDMDSVISVKDLDLPEALEVLSDPDEFIASVTYVAVEEEVEEEEEGELADLLDEEAEPEVIEKGKKEDDLDSEE
jgi:large subunit ribosomal protein L25